MLRLIWILSDGSNADTSSTAKEIETQKQLQDQVELPLTFDNILDYPISLRSSLTSSEKNILIMHADLADETLPEVHHLCHVVCIFVYLNDFQKNFSEHLTQSVDKFKKVIVVKQDDLVKHIEAFNQRWHRNLNDSFSLIISDGDRMNRSATAINGGFVFSQLLVHILLRMKPLSLDREEFCDQCIKDFQKNYESEKNELWLQKMLEQLRKFQEDIYTDDSVLKWYTKDSFLYRILNESLRTDDVAMLFHSRYVIRELNEQLIKRQYNSPVRVYRGQRMSLVEAELLVKSVGQLVCMKSFLSTSLDLKIAEMYADAETYSNTEEIVFVIFIIDASPSENNKRLRPFADISESSHFGARENEILFMLGSVFCITNVEQDVNRRWIVSMTTCDQEDIELNKLFSWFKDRQNINGTDDETFHSFGVLLLGMGMPYETEQLYHHMLNEYKLFPPNDNELARCYHMLGKAAFVAGLTENVNSWWEKPSSREQLSNDDHCKNERSKKILDHLRRAKSKFFHSSRETTTASSSDHSYQLSHFDNGLKRFEQALFYVHKTVPFVYFLAASIHHSSANTYRALRDYKNASTDYEKALLYYKKCLGEEHRLIAEIYTDLGRMYYEKKQLDQALDYYTRGLIVAQKILPDTHPEMGVFHTGIAVVYSEMGKIDEAKFHFEAIANMDLISFPNENSPLCTYYEALYIFYSYKSTIRRTPMAQIPNEKQNYMQRSGIVFYRCPWCHGYVWIYKAFFFCKGSPCFRCLKQLLTLRPPQLNSHFLQYVNYLDNSVRLMEREDVNYLLSRELRQQYLRSLFDHDSIDPR